MKYAVTFRLIGAATALFVSSLQAQQPPRGWIEATSTSVRSHSRFGGSDQSVGGYIWGADVGGMLGNWVARGGYASGSLEAGDGSTAPDREHVEGYLMIGYRPLAGLEISVGPRARALTVAEFTQRWLFWSARARYDAAILPQSLDAYVEYWGAVTGSAGNASTFNSGSGGAVGMTARLPETALYARLEYAIDDASVRFREYRPDLVDVIVGSPGSAVSVPRRETVQGLKASIGLRIR